MSKGQSTLRIREKANLDREIDAFLIDRQARGLSPRTVKYYEGKLGLLREYLTTRGIVAVESINAPILRRLLLELSTTHNPGGVHCIYRAVRAFLNWYEAEVEPEGWSNPIAKVNPPKLSQEPLEPVSLEDLRAMLATCRSKSLMDRRDKAILLVLLDTGLRASEFLAVDIGDIDMATGSILVRRGKGSKFRTAFVGSKARRALVSYLRMRLHLGDAKPLFATLSGNRLTYSGLRCAVRRRAARAGVEPAPTLHSFRRAFAIACLRNGVDIFSLQRLLGHAGLSILRRYLAQTQEDLRRAHQRAGPVDNML